MDLTLPTWNISLRQGGINQLVGTEGNGTREELGEMRGNTSRVIELCMSGTS